jgi:O-antigen/teichoic acid export membrane protein
MSPFWGSLGEHLKDCGRNATLFLLSLAGIFGLLIFVAWILQTSLRDSLAYALPLAGFFLLLWLVVAIRRTFFRRHERSKYSRLSSDELAKARSKLVKNRNRTSL